MTKKADNNNDNVAGTSYAVPQVIKLLAKAMRGELPGILLTPMPRDERR